MSFVSILLLVIVACVILFVKMALVIIPQSETKIIERLGRYYATLNPGVNIIIPFIDKAKSIVVLHQGRYAFSDNIDLREQVYDFPKQNVITKDNVQTEINALLYFQIVDPFKAVYEINNLPNAIEKLTQTTLRNIIGELELDETLTSRDTINKKLSAVLDDATDKWGVKVNRVELQDITPPDTVLKAMEKQMQAERNKRAQILTSEGKKAADILASEGEKTAIINKAEAARQQAILESEGEAQARIRRAEAEAKAIQLVTEALKNTDDVSNPAQYLLAQHYIQMMQSLADGNETKTVYLPYEATSLMGSIEDVEIIRDYFKEIDLARTERHIKDAVLEALGDIRKDDIETDMRITLGKDKSDKGMTFLNCIVDFKSKTFGLDKHELEALETATKADDYQIWPKAQGGIYVIFVYNIKKNDDESTT